MIYFVIYLIGLPVSAGCFRIAGQKLTTDRGELSGWVVGMLFWPVVLTVFIIYWVSVGFYKLPQVIYPLLVKKIDQTKDTESLGHGQPLFSNPPTTISEGSTTLPVKHGPACLCHKCVRSIG